MAEEACPKCQGESQMHIVKWRWCRDCGTLWVEGKSQVYVPKRSKASTTDDG